MSLFTDCCYNVVSCLTGDPTPQAAPAEYQGPQNTTDVVAQPVLSQDPVAATPLVRRQVEVLEGKPGAFYVGVRIPRDVVNRYLKEIPVSPQSIVPAADPHLTLVPPGSSVHPKDRVDVPVEFANNAFDLGRLNINRKGEVILIDRKKSTEYEQLAAALAEQVNGSNQTRSAHAVIGRITDPTIIANYFKEPEVNGFQRIGSNLVCKDLVEPMTVSVCGGEVPTEEQQLLGAAYGVRAKPPYPRNREAEQAFIARHHEIEKVQETARGLFEQGRVLNCPHYGKPLLFNGEQLNLAVRGDRAHGRIPLPFSHILNKGQDRDDVVALWRSFKEEVAEILPRDATVSVLGSAASGFSGNPLKPLKAWTPHSDLDCALLSHTVATECLRKGCSINRKIQMMGRYSVFKNTAENPKDFAFHMTETGAQLSNLEEKWSEKLYGQIGSAKDPQWGYSKEPVIVEPHEVDFKVNIKPDPFQEAISFNIEEVKGE